MPPVHKKPVSKPVELFTNRGPGGLLNKLTDEQRAALKKVELATPAQTKVVARNRVALGLQGMLVDINAPVPDPENARLHPDRNMEAICHSLEAFGQTKPIVVNTRTNIVVAGNGTLAAAKMLGWPDIAVSYVEMSDAEAAAYGLADNRTAELAKWDYEVVARLDKLIQVAGIAMPGWTSDELQVLRAHEWVPPPLVEGEIEQTLQDPLTLIFSPEEYEMVGLAINRMREIQGNEEMTQPAALRLICQEWGKAEEFGRLEGLEEGVDASSSSEEG